jgi:hypothetical protein
LRNLIIPIFLGLMCSSFTIIPTVPTESSIADVVTASSKVFTDSSLTATDAAALLYKNSKLEYYHLSEEAFTNAWKGYQYLLNKKMISRASYLTICDYSQSSRQKRLYILDIATQKLLINTYVAHGKNSGAEYATSFSNTVESLQSSLGFYITSNTYIGKHGLSLRINGVDPGFNNKALERTIVIHGAAYVNEARVRGGMYMGRSWGCPAVPENESEKIITTIKNGTCLFIYHPSRNYLLSSKILND